MFLGTQRVIVFHVISLCLFPIDMLWNIWRRSVMNVFKIAEVPHELVELLQSTTQLLCFYLNLQPAMFGKSSPDSISQNIQLFVDYPNV